MERLSIEEGIDLPWLEREAVNHPIAHAYALWDLARFPDRVRFVTFRRDGVPRAYLLIWYGHPSAPVVRWVGEGPPARALVEGLPGRPLAAVVPEEIVADVQRARGPALEIPILVLSRTGRLNEALPREDEVRRLSGSDSVAVRAFAREQAGTATELYASIDLERETVWGMFAEARLVAIARVAVALPSVWVLAGIFVSSPMRGRGLGTALVAVATRTAMEAGACPVLIVREDNTSARGAYDRLGYQRVSREVWMDAGAGIVP